MGLTRRSAQHLGNFWVDFTRCVLYILLPISIVGALVFVSQGMIQNFLPYITIHTLDGATQVIAQGPVASQEFIKDFGTNGGGFFNVNAAHPFENPNAFTNLLILVSILSIPAALFYMFGKMAGDTRQGWVLWIASAAIVVIGFFVVVTSEQAGNPLFPHTVTQPATSQTLATTQPGGNMEGKEVRFGITDSAVFAVTTTVTSCGSVNSFHDSFTPIAGMIPLTNIALGEIAFGGVGSGHYGMIVFAILAVFIAGLMVGRTPEYLGKKIERKEIMMAALAILILPASILGFTAVAVLLPQGLAGYFECWATWALGSPVCLLIDHWQQWFGLCRVDWQYPVLQLDLGYSNVDWSFRLPYSHHGIGRLAREKEGGTSRAGYLPNNWYALCDTFDRCYPDCRCADLLPCLCARARCRAVAYACGQDVLAWVDPNTNPKVVSNR